MSRVLDELIALLGLERLEEHLFRGQSQDLGWGVVYGGQVLGQAISAAAQTVPRDRHVHSLHSYFLRPGDVTKPIVYDVDSIRDGSSFTTRRVVAIQGGHAIFNMQASFQVLEEGFEHQDPMPDVGPPESFPTEQERLRAHLDVLPAILRERAMAPRPFEMRPVDWADDSVDPAHPTVRPPRRSVWLRTDGALPDDEAIHRSMLAYVSDYAFMTTSLLPHGVTWLTKGMQVASLDHVMWFHEAFRADEWMLHVMESPKACGARGLVRGRVYTKEGRLVASTAQEGLIRHRR